VEVDAVVPYHRGDLVARVHRHGQVRQIGHTVAGTRVVARVDPELAAALHPFRSAGDAAVGERAG
jgi:GTP-binding protein HflX